MNEITGYAVLMDSKQNEASERVRVTCELKKPRRVGAGLQVDMRIKEAPITLIPNVTNAVVHAVVVFDEGEQMPIGRSDWWYEITRGNTFTITS